MTTYPIVQSIYNQCLCCLCKYWQAVDWNGWMWRDSKALCSVSKEQTPRGKRCEHGIALNTNEFRTRVKAHDDIIEALHTTPSIAFNIDSVAGYVADEMEQWYKENQFLFESTVTPAGETTVYTKQEGDIDIDWNSFSVEDQQILKLCLGPNIHGDRLYLHQQEDFFRFKDDTEMAEFAEQGCGKSAIILRIAAWKYLHKQIDSLLIIAPNDVHKQWAIEQIPLWLPEGIAREVQLFGGRGGAKDTYPFRYPDYFHIVCVNIDTFSQPTKWQDIAYWVKSTRCMVILDEATCIKNIKTKRTERLLYEFNDVVRSKTRIISSVPKTVARAILTGTPTTNSHCDLWALMEFERPNYFNRNWYSFRNRYAMLATITTAYGTTQIMITSEMWEGIKRCKTYEEAFALFGVSSDTYNTVQTQDHYQGAYKHEDELKELIKPISSFRLLKDCVDMPPQVYNKKVISMSDEQRRCYVDMEKELLAMFGGATTTAANKLSALIRLAQISSGFIVQGNFEYDADNPESWWGQEYDLEPGQVQWLGSSIPKLEALYRDVEESARPCIIITRFSAEAARIYDDLGKEFSCLLYTGWKKTGAIEEFKEGKHEILIANIRCISRGFNLQNAYQMFFYSNSFSLEDRLQTEGRIFRIGQTNTCIYTDYINEGTVDLKVVGALRQKRQLLDYIRGTTMKVFIEEEDEVSMIEEAV